MRSLNTVNSTREFNKLVISRQLFRNVLIFFMQYAGLMFTTLASNDSVAWFASGSACAFIFLQGSSILPGLWLGSLLAYYVAGLNLGLAASCATILALQAYCLLKLNYRFSILTLVFSHPSICITFLSITALITACGSLLLSYVCYGDTHLWLPWWLANFNGTVIIGCALVAWDAYFPELQKIKSLNKFKLMTAYGMLLVLIFIILSDHSMLEMTSILISLLVLVISRIYKWCGALAALFLVIFFLSFFPVLDARVFLKVVLAGATMLALLMALSFHSMGINKFARIKV